MHDNKPHVEYQMDRYNQNYRLDYLHSLHGKFLRDNAVVKSNQNHLALEHYNDQFF